MSALSPQAPTLKADNPCIKFAKFKEVVLRTANRNASWSRSVVQTSEADLPVTIQTGACGEDEFSKRPRILFLPVQVVCRQMSATAVTEAHGNKHSGANFYDGERGGIRVDNNDKDPRTVLLTSFSYFLLLFPNLMHQIQRSRTPALNT
ncbi:hypothetical protein MG293_002861 [Ovis ammon polii]|uniref:Uncharacterized protein n=1 Tax=Ovis ammon polii TaxID=230172 RepID=A0AAD4UHY6_OVIAM|nr:hypothetical protein MG293_002861 [Ovis ammon polii]